MTDRDTTRDYALDWHVNPHDLIEQHLCNAILADPVLLARAERLGDRKWMEWVQAFAGTPVLKNRHPKYFSKDTDSQP
jgi:hypothetical protein